MTPEQEQFVTMLEDAGLIPNLVMVPNTTTGEWGEVQIEVRYRGQWIGMSFNPDGKLIEVETE